jgi:hypothetical protein
MKKSNYDLVLKSFKNYEFESMLNDFKNEFKEDENVNEKDYFEFCKKYINDEVGNFVKGEYYYFIEMNWKIINNEGDESVLNEDDYMFMMCWE